MQQITPFLWFSNQAEEAMTLYVVTRVGLSPSSHRVGLSPGAIELPFVASDFGR